MGVQNFPQKIIGANENVFPIQSATNFGTIGGPSRQYPYVRLCPNVYAGISFAPVTMAIFTNPYRLRKYNVSTPRSIAMHSATPPGMITAVFPARSILSMHAFEIGSNPNHVHRCFTSGTLNIAALASARAPRLAAGVNPRRRAPSSSCIKYSANDITLSGSTPCGSSPITHASSFLTARRYASSSSNSNRVGKYAVAVLVTARANRAPHLGVATVRGIAAAATSVASAVTAIALGSVHTASAVTATST
mmetsp:Transcript_5803/g.22930  ORF Transcript_5803/g.22930 Transcript_5803/m.22930 type:complete len:249 (+) Transcript_5803:1038-1784(+)